MKKDSQQLLMNLLIDVDPNLDYRQIIEKIISIYSDELGCESVCFINQLDDEVDTYLVPETLEVEHQNSVFFKRLHNTNNTGEKFLFDLFNGLNFYAFQMPECGWLVLIHKYQFSEVLLKDFKKPLNYLTDKLVLAYKTKFSEKLLNRLNIQNELVDEILSGIIIVKLDGSLFYLNKTARKWTGIDKNNKSDFKIYDIEGNFEDKQEQKWLKHVEELKILDELKVEGKIRNVLSDKITFADVSLKYFSIYNREFIIANLVDTTEKLYSEKKLSEEIKLQELLLSIAGDYLNINYSKIEETIQKSLGELGSYVNADRVYIFDYDFNTETCSNTYEWCAKGISPEIVNLQDVPLKFFPEWVEKHRKKEAFIIDNIDELPDSGDQGLKAILSAQNIKSLITLPMFDCEHLIGFVGFDSVYHLKRYSVGEIKLLSLFSHMLVNIQIRKHWENNFKIQKNRYRSIINDVNLGLIEVNEYFEIKFVNNNFCYLLGYEVDELINLNSLQTFLDDEAQINLYERLVSLKEGENVSLELHLFNKQKIKKPVLISICPIVDKFNQTKGYLGSLIDLENQKTIERHLKKAKEKAEIASKAKETFLANISHEMRTPLHIINGTINEVLKTTLDEEQAYLLGRCNLASAHLLNLVNNVLDMAKIKSDEIHLDLNSQNLYNTTKEVYEMLKLLADENQIDFNFHFNLNQETKYLYDTQKLNQLLINLISNAIKFTKKGSVDFFIEVTEDFEAYSIINFRIKDTGIGMSEEFKSNLFQSFKRENDFGVITENGTGLGMPISKRLVRLMGGNIIVKSKKNEGSEFSFDLKLKKASTIIDHQEYKKDFGTIEGKDILVVEDNLMSQILIKKKLKRRGANISLCKDGLEAIQILKKESYDVILLDMQMPKLSGLETAKIIREDLQLNTSIIIVTANVFSKDIDKFKLYDVEDYILKPFKDEDLFSKISKVLRTQTSGLSDERSLITKGKKYSTERLLEVVGGDVQFMKELMETFQTILKETLVQMKTNMELKNWKAMLKVLHKIKPSLIDLEIHDAVHEIKVVEENNISSFDEARYSFEKLLKILQTVYYEIKDIEN